MDRHEVFEIKKAPPSTLSGFLHTFKIQYHKSPGGSNTESKGMITTAYAMFCLTAQKSQNFAGIKSLTTPPKKSDNFKSLLHACIHLRVYALEMKYIAVINTNSAYTIHK